MVLLCAGTNFRGFKPLGLAGIHFSKAIHIVCYLVMQNLAGATFSNLYAIS